jgi:hypothetical protein
MVIWFFVLRHPAFCGAAPVVFGENLGATNDLAKRITKLLVASF